MPGFPEPSFVHNYDLDEEILNLQNYRNEKPGRQIPDKQDNKILVATWNIANLGVQKRRAEDYGIISEMISWFDLVAIQEVNDDLVGLRKIQEYLPDSYRSILSDKAGNNERMVFLYDSLKIKPLEKVGEIAIPPKDHLDDIVHRDKAGDDEFADEEELKKQIRKLRMGNVARHAEPDRARE